MIRGALVLAAGMGRRMSGPNKMLLPFRGKPMVRWAVEAACASCADRVVLVTGRDGEAVWQAAETDLRIERVHNPAPERGLASSLQLGLSALNDADAIAVLLGDMPLVDAALVDHLFSGWRDDAYALVPTHEGVIGNPVILSAQAARDCMALEGDSGARKLINAHASNVVSVEVSDAAIFADVDSRPDLARLS
jgi:molybdenum cofactor cytidylyltransferase